MVLGGLEGALLISRLDGNVARFHAAADRLLGTLTGPSKQGLSTAA